MLGLSAGAIRRDLESLTIAMAYETLRDLERRRDAAINAALAGGRSTEEAIAAGDTLFRERIDLAAARYKAARDRYDPFKVLEQHASQPRPWWQFWP